MSKQEQLKKSVCDAALAVAKRDGWDALTRENVAGEAKVSTGSVSNAYGSMELLRLAVMSAAVAGQCAPIVAVGLARGYESARNAPQGLKVRALAVLAA